MTGLIIGLVVLFLCLIVFSQGFHSGTTNSGLCRKIREIPPLAETRSALEAAVRFRNVASSRA